MVKFHSSSFSIAQSTHDASPTLVSSSHLETDDYHAGESLLNIASAAEHLEKPISYSYTDLYSVAVNLNAEIISESDLQEENKCRVTSKFMSRKIQNLLNDYDNFFIVNLGSVVERYKLWNQYLPRVTPHYAVKCNPDVGILLTLAALGCGFDCASQGEIEECFKIGVAASNIIYANPCKLASQIRYSASAGVQRTTFDNVAELYKLKAMHPTAKCVLRIVTDDSGSTCGLSCKFGSSMSDVRSILLACQDFGMDFHGVSFHVGSGCKNPLAFTEPIKNASIIFKMAKEYNLNPTLLDIGGGFPGSDDITPFPKIADAITMALDTYFPAAENVQIISEPGRFFAAQSSTLAVSVFAKRTDCNSRLYYCSDGLYGSFNCIMYDHYDKVIPHLAERDGEVDSSKLRFDETLYPSKVFGPTCDGLDCILPSIKLPELDIGDWLYFEEMGAYSWAAASSFNGFEPPKRFYVFPDYCL